MRWNIILTQKQAEETAKYLLNISQATVLASAGVLFVPDFTVLIRIIFLILGMVIAFILYRVAMRLLEGVKNT